MQIRKLLRVLHRDIGYFVVGITIIYIISGIALNHRQDWNPDYSVTFEELNLPIIEKTILEKQEIEALLSKFENEPIYKKHYTSKDSIIKIFVESGNVIYKPLKGHAELELLSRRPILYEFNRIHLAKAGRLWIWVSDIMAFLLLFVAISGIFILKGKNGITRRGLWLTAAGIIVPVVIILIYVN